MTRTARTISFIEVGNGAQRTELPLFVSSGAALSSSTNDVNYATYPYAGQLMIVSAPSPDGRRLLRAVFKERQIASFLITSDRAVLQACTKLWWWPENVISYFTRLDADSAGLVVDPAFTLTPADRWGFVNGRWTGRGCFDPVTKRLPSYVFSPRFELATESQITGRGDPWKCLERLRQEVHLHADLMPEPAYDRFPFTLYRLSKALGYCRLFGVVIPPEDDFTLSRKVLLATMRQFVFEAEMGELFLEDLLDPNADSFSQDLMPLQLLQLRMDLWAAYLAIDEAYMAHSRPGRDHVLSSRLRTVRKAIEDFDVNLQNNIQRLTPAAATFALENWRRLLAPCFRSLLPWWLDGSIEALRQ